MKIIYLLLTLLVISQSSFAQNSNDTLLPKTMEGVKVMKFISSINHNNYVILISLPASYNDCSKKTYPEMYTLDAQWSFPYALHVRDEKGQSNRCPI